MASNNEIERLTVVLESDYSKLVQQTKEGVDKAAKELDKLSEAPKKAQGGWEQFGSFLSGKFLALLTSVGAAVAAAFSVSVVTRFFASIASGMVDTGRQFEVYTTQFEALLGSQSEAQKRVSELAQFGKTTPFELPEITQANRLLQTFGDNVLASNEEMRKMGDAAASVNAPISELAMWWGRLYDAIQSGRPMGEALMRMQELGLVSGDLRGRLEEMQKAGVDANQMWETFTSEVGEKSAGAMDKLSRTLEGIISNLSDYRQMLLRLGGQELFEGTKQDAEEFLKIISDPEAEKAIVELAKAFGDIFDSIRESITSPFLEQLREIDPAKAESLADSIQDIGDAIDNLSGVNVGSLEDLVEHTDSLAQSTASLLQFVSVLKELSFTVSGLKGAGDALDMLDMSIFDVTPLGAMSTAFNNLNNEVERLTGSSLSEWLGGVDREITNVSSSLNAMDLSGAQTGGKKPAPTEEPEDFSEARERFEKLSQDFFDAQQEIGEKREELEKDHGEKVAEIVENYGERVAELEEEIADRREEIVKDTADKLADLEKEGAERREEVAENTAKALKRLAEETASSREEAQEGAREALAELEADTQSAVEEVQEEARDKERRETEDHQREMRRLQQNYLLDLEDAVKSRDARAIVDLRRKHTQEMREREEDFRVQQTRNRSDTRKKIEDAREAEEKRKQEIEEALEKQLEEIEENEEKKREEIEASQQEQLEELSEAEAEKRAEIEASQAEQLAKLEELEAEKRAKIDESLAEQLAAEQESYAERQALLDQALAKKLEAVAQQLAQEKEVTEAGAQAILETLNQYYGAGGEIDQLMDAYRERQASQAAAAGNFDANLPGGGPGGGDFNPAGSGGGAGLPAFAQGGIVGGPINKPKLAIVHGGELIIPPEQASQWQRQQGEMMAQNSTGGGEMNLNLKISGSAPPGVKGAEIEQLAGMMVSALREAGINARRK